jgi:type I restriction enzyme, R subunit
MPETPKQQARQTIDAMLAEAGWAVQYYKAFNPSASTGIALCEVPLKTCRCDYLFLVNPKPVGVIEAKKEGIISHLAEQIRIMAEVARRLSLVE